MNHRTTAFSPGRRIATLACAALLAAGAPAAADFFQTFSGNTTGAPTFLRPVGGGPSQSTNAVRYRIQGFFLASASQCTIYSAQDYDGYLHLYDGSFDPTSPLVNLLAGDDDAELGIGTSRIPADLGTNAIDLPAGFYILVTSAFSTTGQGSFENFIQCSLAQPVHGGCFFSGYPRDQQICPHDRFAVKIDQVTNHPSDGRATPVRFGSTDSGFFWFFNDRNYEVLVKVLNGCGVNGHWWVFFAGTTNQGHRIQVGDVDTQQVNTYNRALGPPAAAETDTVAFPCP